MLYRDPEEGYRARRTELLGARGAEIAELGPRPLGVLGRRLGRQAAGGMLLVAGAILAVTTIEQTPGRVRILLAAWPVAIVALILGRTIGDARSRRALVALVRETDDLVGDVERLEDTALSALRKLAAREEQRGVWLPLAGLFTMLPLTMHFVLATLLTHGEPMFRDFDVWITWSLILVGHCHLVLIYYAVRFARTGPTAGATAGWRALGMSVLASLLPGVVATMFSGFVGVALFICVPALVALTGIVFVPFAFARMHATIRRERSDLGQ